MTNGLYRAKIMTPWISGLGVVLGADWPVVSKGSRSFLQVLRTAVGSAPHLSVWSYGEVAEGVILL